MKNTLQSGGVMLRELRESNKITQKELSLKLNVDKSYISRLERYPESCNPTLNIILGLSEHLNITPHALLDYFIQSRNHDT
jgi:transcriptional regulator with XRE-family HTH domain